MALLFAVAASPAVARAQTNPNAPVSKGNEYSPYEKETIADVLHDRHAEIDPNP